MHLIISVLYYFLNSPSFYLIIDSCLIILYIIKVIFFPLTKRCMSQHIFQRFRPTPSWGESQNKATILYTYISSSKFTFLEFTCIKFTICKIFSLFRPFVKSEHYLNTCSSDTRRLMYSFVLKLLCS